VAPVVWSEPALADLDAIADYIALEDPAAARALVTRLYTRVGQLGEHPRSGTRLPELGRGRYRQLLEPPCRLVYREGAGIVIILHVIRLERFLRPNLLAAIEDPE
jgi:toxin ParE1/3/4